MGIGFIKKRTYNKHVRNMRIPHVRTMHTMNRNDIGNIGISNLVSNIVEIDDEPVIDSVNDVVNETDGKSVIEDADATEQSVERPHKKNRKNRQPSVNVIVEDEQNKEEKRQEHDSDVE